MARLRQGVAAVCLVLLVGLAGAAVAADDPAAEAIRGVIEAQLDAFRRDDGDAAFAYASPTIQGAFRDPESFMTMVRQGYRPVYRPRRVAFGRLAAVDGRVAQFVHVIGPDGLPATAVYFMQQQADGAWRIDGCMLLDAPEAAA